MDPSLIYPSLITLSFLCVPIHANHTYAVISSLSSLSLSYPLLKWQHFHITLCPFVPLTSQFQVHQLRNQANEVAEVAAAAALDWDGHIPHPSSYAPGTTGDVMTSSSSSYRSGGGSGGGGNGTGGAGSYSSSGYHSGATPSYKGRTGNITTMTTTMNSTSSSSSGRSFGGYYIPS